MASPSQVSLLGSSVRIQKSVDTDVSVLFLITNCRIPSIYAYMLIYIGYLDGVNYNHIWAYKQLHDQDICGFMQLDLHVENNCELQPAFDSLIWNTIYS